MLLALKKPNQPTKQNKTKTSNEQNKPNHPTKTCILCTGLDIQGGKHNYLFPISSSLLINSWFQLPPMAYVKQRKNRGWGNKQQ